MSFQKAAVREPRTAAAPEEILQNPTLKGNDRGHPSGLLGLDAGRLSAPTDMDKVAFCLLLCSSSFSLHSTLSSSPATVILKSHHVLPQLRNLQWFPIFSGMKPYLFTTEFWVIHHFQKGTPALRPHPPSSGCQAQESRKPSTSPSPIFS